MAAAKPWMKFYPRDWRADEKLRLCSYAARGLWIEMMALMHSSERYGRLLVNGKEPTIAQLASLTSGAPDECERLIDELRDAGVFSTDAKGALYSRRMVQDDRDSALARKHGSEGGNPKLKGGYSKAGFIYLIGVRSDGAYKIGCSVNPSNRLNKIRAQYRGQDLAVIDSWRVENMGAVEAECHEIFAAKASGEWFFLTAADIGKLREKFSTLMGAEKGGEMGDQKRREQSPDSVTNVTGADGASPVDPNKIFWANAKAMLQPFCKGDPGKVVGQWLRDHGKETTTAAITAAQLEEAVNPIEYCQGYFRRNGAKAAKPAPGSDEAYLEHFLEDRRQRQEFEARQAAAGGG